MQMMKPTLLVVDDDCEVLETSSALLRHFGFAVVSTGDPAEALDLLEHNSDIDGMVCDYRMPIMSGEELARSAKKLRPELPIFILSGTYPPDRHPAPWDAWFLKGAPIAELLAKLDTVTLSKRDVDCAELRRERNAS